MARDIYTSLLELRDREVTLAQRDLAAHLSEEAEARRAVAAVTTLLHQELSDTGMNGAAFAAWMPRARAEGVAAARRLDLAGQAVAAARATLDERRARKRGTELLLERRAAEARRLRLRQEQIVLDDITRTMRFASANKG